MRAEYKTQFQKKRNESFQNKMHIIKVCQHLIICVFMILKRLDTQPLFLINHPTQDVRRYHPLVWCSMQG